MEDSEEALKALGGHCSAIDSDTLYVLSDSKLLSLPLRKNATVSEETSPAQNVTEPACVKAGDGTGAALYVIGGSGTPDDYMGLQRYFFANSTWETLSPPANILQTRTNHSAAYLKDSQEILIYAGSTDDAPSLLSSQTFLLSTKPPYTIRSFTSNAPPATHPILEPWNSTHAVMVGGESTNTGVWLFGAGNGWQQLGTNLSQPLDASARGVLVDGTDGSKVLQLYDLNASPNTVSNIVLLKSGGEIAPPGQTVNGTSKRTRDLNLENWPSYNSTNAPTSTRADCSIAQNSQGLVVMAGGNKDEPIVMFNQQKNSWIDTDEFFGVKQQQPLLPSSTPSSTPSVTSTASPSASTSATSGSKMSAHDRMMMTLGITLGVLCGIAAIFILALLFLRWRKLKAKRKAGYLQEKDGGDANRMSFADRGASFMKEAGMSADDLSPPNWQPSENHNAHSSLAIITGKYGNSRNTNSHAPKASFESTAQLVKNKNGQLVPTDNVEMMDIGSKSQLGTSSKLAVPGAALLKGNSLDQNTRAERKRSSGWSKYFATTAPNGLSHLPSAYVKPGTSSRESEYSADGATSQKSRISAAVLPPLDFAKIGDGHRLSKVTTGSPSFFDSKDDFARRGSHDVGEGQRGLIVDPRRSEATSISSYGNRSTMDSTATSLYYNESGHTPWTPMSGDVTSRDPVPERERRTSSVYTASAYDASPRRPSRGKSTGFFPGAGTNYVKTPKTKLSHAAAPAAEWAAPPKAPFAAKPGEARESTSSVLTVFPDGRGSYYDKDDKENVAEAANKPTNDMSWVKLG